MILKNRVYIVFGIDHYNPLGVIRTLGENGIKPIFIAMKGRAEVASSSKYVSETIWVEDYIEGCKLLLERFGNYEKNNLPIVITTDDEQVNYMDENYELYKDKFIFFNAGQAGQITKYMDKYNILMIAKKHGLNILPSWTVQRGQIPDDIAYPIITKSISPVIGGWKSDVYICENEEELVNAYAKIEAPQVLLQRFVDKKNELCLDGFSIDNGRKLYLAIASTYNYNIRGYYSPYMTVTNFKNDELSEKLSSMMAEIGFNGIFSIEFLLDQDDTLYFSEVNFRNSTWSYGATAVGMPIPILWAEAMQSGQLPEIKKIDEPFTAMVEPIDYAKRVKTGMISLTDWLIDFKESKVGYYYDIHDRKPFEICIKNWERLG